MPEETAPITPEAPPVEAASAEAAAEAEKQQSWLDSLEPQVAGEIRRLRDESAGYRTKLREAEAPFQSYTPEERAVWNRLATTFAEDPEAGARAMQDIANGVLTPAQAATQAEAQAGGEQPTYVTKADLDERDRQAGIRTEVEKMQAEAHGLDARYSPDSDDYFLLLKVAQRHAGDLKAAHTEIEAARQAVIDDYVKSLKDTANGTVNSPRGGNAPGSEKAITTFEDAKASTLERLKQLA